MNIALDKYSEGASLWEYSAVQNESKTPGMHFHF